MTTTVLVTEVCGCGHDKADHDEIAARFCRATAAQGLTRGCICKKLLSAHL